MPGAAAQTVPSNGFTYVPPLAVGCTGGSPMVANSGEGDATTGTDAPPSFAAEA